MRRLRSPIGVIPRAYPDSRKVEARRYREYCITVQEAWGPLPPIALSTLREAGRAAVELEKLGNELEAARARNRLRDARRIRRDQFALREQLQRLERRLEELGSSRRPESPMAAIGRLREAK
jgi:hypothetical protein